MAVRKGFIDKEHSWDPETHVTNLRLVSREGQNTAAALKQGYGSDKDMHREGCVSGKGVHQIRIFRSGKNTGQGA